MNGYSTSTQYQGVTAASLFSIAGPDGRDRGWRRRSARPQLFPDNGHVRRRFNAQAHPTSFNLRNGDNNAIANDEPFALLAAQNQHGSLLRTHGETSITSNNGGGGTVYR